MDGGLGGGTCAEDEGEEGEGVEEVAHFEREMQIARILRMDRSRLGWRVEVCEV